MGIHDPELVSYVVTNKIRIYASPFTVQLIRNRERFSELHDSFHPLELDIPHKIPIDCDESAYTVTVTLTSAEHIIGSAMFLLERESPKFRCLYTGDFRLTKQDLKLKKCFKLHKGVKVFNAVYFDSTWCTPDNLWTIPTREDVLGGLEPLIDRHLQEDPSNYICIYTMYDVGYENMLRDLAKIADSGIHVTEERLSLYQGFPGMLDIFTTDSEKCRVHFCQKGFPNKSKGCSKVRRDYLSGRAMKLLFSYKSFIAEHKLNQEQEVYVKNKRVKDMYNVCWSTHPSLEEVSDLLNYLSPDSIHANVVRDCPEEDILRALESGSISRKKWHVSDQISNGKRKQESNSQSSNSNEDSQGESLLDRLRVKGCIEKRKASPTPSLALLEGTDHKKLL